MDFKHTFSSFLSGGWFVVFFAWSTYSFVDYYYYYYYCNLIFVNKIVSGADLNIGLNTINPMFTGSWLLPLSAVSSHCLLPDILLYSKTFQERLVKNTKWKVIITQVTSVPHVGVSRLYMISVPLCFHMFWSGYNNTVTFVQ